MTGLLPRATLGAPVPSDNQFPRVQPGKLPADKLRTLLAGLNQEDPRVIIGPKVGEDASVITFADRCLVITTDPVTFATDRIGWYTVHVNANDIAVMGATPRWLSVVLLLPEHHTTETLIDGIMRDVHDTAQSLGITVCGGHTEITTGLDRPIVIGQMLGEVTRDRLVAKTGLEVGDQIILTQGVAIEGTALLAREKRDVLRGQVTDDVLARAEQFLFDPGISVVGAVRTALEVGSVHAMHDPTEGGLIGGLCELAAASSTGLHLQSDRVPIFPETAAVCRPFKVDPMRLIASGALLIGAPENDTDRIIAALELQNIPAVVIAEVRPAAAGVTIEANGVTLPLQTPDRDAITSVLGH
ncbi:MAG: hydrogenase expression protein [Acidobacteria bacterium]|nr:hydrogenase expression protein [Acidobacteriota bacterium]